MKILFQDQRSAASNPTVLNQDALFDVASAVGMDVLSDIDLRIRVRPQTDEKQGGYVAPVTQETEEGGVIVDNAYRLVVYVPDVQPGEYDFAEVNAVFGHQLRHLAVLQFCPHIYDAASLAVSVVGLGALLLIEKDATDKLGSIEECAPVLSVATTVE